MPRSQRLCTVCHVGRSGDEYHLVFQCQGSHHIRDIYFGWYEHGKQSLASCGKQICMGLQCLSQIVWAFHIPGGVEHLISPRWLEEVKCLSLSLSLSLSAWTELLGFWVLSFCVNKAACVCHSGSFWFWPATIKRSYSFTNVGNIDDSLWLGRVRSNSNIC